MQTGDKGKTNIKYVNMVMRYHVPPRTTLVRLGIDSTKLWMSTGGMKSTYFLIWCVDDGRVALSKISQTCPAGLRSGDVKGHSI